MAGVKGRSGVATTREHKLAKAAAARKRWGSPEPGTLAPGPPGKPPQPIDGDLRTIAEHDAHIGRPVTWGDALKRLQLIEQDIINERREVELEGAQVDLDERRGRLVERAELDKLATLIRDAWWTSAQQITSDTLAALASMSTESREMVRVAADAAVRKSAERVKAALA